MSVAVGIDIGGTGIKIAPVDTSSGRLLSPARTTPTPRPAVPEAVGEAVAGVLPPPTGPVGVGFPGVVRHGVAMTAANLDPAWVGLDVGSVLARGEVRPVVVNDADAAGLAEMSFGSARGRRGVVVMVTLGTGIGTAVFSDGVLVPNSEYGHLVIDGVEAEQLASGRAQGPLGWEHWTGHLERVLRHIERLVWPDLFVIGGGISVEFERFCRGIHIVTPVTAAALGNEAGIIGAAMATTTVAR